MKRSAIFLLTACSALGFVCGCDQVQQFFKGSSGAPVVTPAQQSAASTEEAAQVAGTVLAKVNNAVITLEGFDEKVKKLETLSRGNIKINTQDARKAYLNDLITQELVYQESLSRGMEKKKEVQDALEDSRKSIMAGQLILDETQGIAIDPSEIEAYYNQFKQEFAAPAEVKVREIVVSAEATAKEIMIALLQGGDFGAAARERSIAASAAKGGALGFVKRGEKFAKFDEVTAPLDAGQVSPIFKGPEGYYIVKVEEKKGGVPPSLNEVYEQIREGLTQQKQAQRVRELADRLRKDAKIEIKEELL